MIAADQFELAKQTAQKDDPRISALFDEAVARRDIEVAAAVNRIEENTLQQYIDTLETIDFPGGFDARVDDLQAKIRAGIEFDKKQVDVANASEIVQVPPEGSVEFQSRVKAETALMDDLRALEPKSDEPEATC